MGMLNSVTFVVIRYVFIQRETNGDETDIESCRIISTLCFDAGLFAVILWWNMFSCGNEKLVKEENTINNIDSRLFRTNKLVIAPLKN